MSKQVKDLEAENSSKNIEEKSDKPDFRILPTDLAYDSESKEISFGAGRTRRRSIYKTDGQEYYRDFEPFARNRIAGSEAGVEIYKLVNAKSKSNLITKCTDSISSKMEMDSVPDHLKPRYKLYPGRLVQVYAGIPILTFITKNIANKTKDEAISLVIKISLKAYAALEDLHKNNYAHGDLHAAQLLFHNDTVTLIDYECTAKQTDMKVLEWEVVSMHRICAHALQLIAKKFSEEYKKEKDFSNLPESLFNLWRPLSQKTSCKNSIDYLSAPSSI